MSKQETLVEDADMQEFTKAVSSILSVMRSLTRIMGQETDALSQKNMESMTSIRQEKLRLRRDYCSFMNVLVQHPQKIKELPQETRNLLQQGGEQLTVATTKNMQVLKTAITATQALVSTVIDAARRHCVSRETYGDPRKIGAHASPYSPTCTPVAVNRTA